MLVRFFIYLWTLPTTLFGVPFVLLAPLTGGGVQLVRGVLEVYGGIARVFLRFLTPLPGGATAMTLGHIVLARTRKTAERTRAHERVHVRQAERWGPFFIPAYLLASVWAFLRGRRPYLDNPFEREAYLRG